MIIKNCRICRKGQEEITDVQFDNGLIVAIGALDVTEDDTFDAKGKWLLPGCVDLSHPATPEMISSSDKMVQKMKKGLKGGMTTLLLSGSEGLSIDDTVTMEYIHLKAKSLNECRVELLVDSVKKGEWNKLSDNAILAKEGACGFRISTQSDANTLVRTMQYAKFCDRTVFIHPVNVSLDGNGVIHDSVFSASMGLPVLGSLGETSELARIGELARVVGCNVVIEGVSSGESLMIALPSVVQKMVSIHHLALDEEAVGGFNTYAKNYPPLREKKDKDALQVAVADGEIVAIFSQSLSSSQASKDVAFESASFGIEVDEIYFPLAYTILSQKGLSMSRICELCATMPAKLAGLHNIGAIDVGMRADCMLFDTQKVTVVKEESTLNRRSPYYELILQGSVEKVWVDAQLRFNKGKE